jgi:hypothetical protein
MHSARPSRAALLISFEVQGATAHDWPCSAANSPAVTASRYEGRTTVSVPYRGTWQNLSAGQQAINRAHAKIRALVEQAMATLKTWRHPRKLRCSTTRITGLVQAVLTLHLNGSNRVGKAHRSPIADQTQGGLARQPSGGDRSLRFADGVQFPVEVVAQVVPGQPAESGRGSSHPGCWPETLAQAAPASPTSAG